MNYNVKRIIASLLALSICCGTVIMPSEKSVLSEKVSAEEQAERKGKSIIHSAILFTSFFISLAIGYRFRLANIDL